ncbi:bifunctional DNA-formamidopyrimidine glycosylase/DNA-(apurinic or apyrimidinic site) lyase [Polymorphobacter megasporae]|uniref:bifunctional DNA-formamidopyrimidine glycosylase/DNA-(apurinic or apyrimidinic site) lyase n=1 Tax=Glacieibacterium megasporae TaxID=2835787 RepID=UPI001C1E8951|nr:bifunctional DNA-formamidopyrimidine glycosylase/DNA-(apurinic or apyrimidinic site) lyase [Polymorphobacter megasporae]UAJ11686.1 bifunctional DNA-formamidopyrimidine glycosylase/DNA-(apurinic or apyrimidinic site) lyase [Polymorphobacter megasporae]
MPELPEVETVVRGLRPVLVGRRLARVELHREGLRRAFPEGLVQRLTGAVITGIERRAKYGLIATDRGDTLIFHLGMSGRMRLDPAEIGKHDHAVFTTGDGHRVAFNDARRFGSLDLVPTAEVAAYPAFVALGPEPLGPGLTSAYLKAAFAGRIAPIKPLLLDQRIIAGLGNIYACEALYIAGIDPARPAGSVSAAKLKALVPAIHTTLNAAIAAGGSSLRDHVQVDGTLGYFQKSFCVYGREGEACPDGRGIVERIVQGGRSTFFCRHRQR